MRFRFLYFVLVASSRSISYVITPYSSDEGTVSDFVTSEIQQDGSDDLSLPTDQTNTIGQTNRFSDLDATSQIGGSNPVNQPGQLNSDNQSDGSDSVIQPDQSSSVNQFDGSSLTTQSGDLNAMSYGYAGPVKTIQIWGGPSGGVQELSYYATPDGSAIIHGDIVWGPESDLLAQQVNSDADFPLKPRAYSIPANTGWPNGEIIYKYDSDDGEAAVSDSINRALAVWLGGAPYLKFTKTHPNSAEPAHGILTIYTQSCVGVSSWVGYEGRPKMQMQRGCEHPTEGKYYGPVTQDGIIHEFGHVLGMQHEHQRPDRDKFIRYQCENLNPQCNTMPKETNCCNPKVPKGCCKFKHDFEIIYMKEGDYTGPYDFHSIMQYRADSLAYRNKKTLVSLVPGESVPEVTPAVPSAMDFSRICKLYSKQCQKFKAAS